LVTQLHISREVPALAEHDVVIVVTVFIDADMGVVLQVLQGNYANSSTSSQNVSEWT
jgi:hypothetical protein